jgi:hypothetical protein
MHETQLQLAAIQTLLCDSRVQETLHLLNKHHTAMLRALFH